MADNSGILNQFFGGAKTIQKAYDFFVEFGDEYPNLKLFHVKNVQIPQGSFKADNQLLGAFSKLMPIFDSTNHFELRITLEEDEYSNVQNAIFLMRNKMMNPDTGYVNLTYDNLGPKVVPSVFAIKVALKAPNFGNNSKVSVQKRFYTFRDCYLIGVQEPTFDYTSNTAIDFTLTFSCQYMEFENHNVDVQGVTYGITQEPAPVMVASTRSAPKPVEQKIPETKLKGNRDIDKRVTASDVTRINTSEQKFIAAANNKEGALTASTPRNEKRTEGGVGRNKIPITQNNFNKDLITYKASKDVSLAGNLATSDVKPQQENLTPKQTQLRKDQQTFNIKFGTRTD